MNTMIFLREHNFHLSTTVYFINILLTEINGFAHIAVSSTLLDKVKIPSSKWTKIVEWQHPSDSGNVASSASFVNGEFTTPYSGIYNVFTTITFSPENGLSRLAASINNNIPPLHPGLTSTFQNVQGVHSLSVYGTLRMHVGYTLSIFVYSEIDAVIIKDAESIFCVEFIGFHGSVPGFSSHLVQTSYFGDHDEWKEIPGWKSSGGLGLFKSLTGFSEGIGLYSAIWDGIYQVSANIKFVSRSKGRYYLAFALNGDTTGNTIFYDAHRSNEVFTLSLSIALKFSKGDEIKLMTKGDGKYSISDDCGFCGVLLNQGGVPGFSTVFLSPVSGNQNSWVNIKIPTPTSTYGQFEAIKGRLIDGRYSHPQRRLFTISALLHIQASSSAGLLFTLQTDESSITAMKTGVGTFTKKNIPSDKASYSLSGILEIPEDQKISLYIHLESKEEYSILNGSRVSVTSNQQDYQAFHVTLKSMKSIESSSTWIRLSNWRVSTDTSAYSLTTQFPRGKSERYIASITGIYYLMANIIFKEASGPIALVISIDEDIAKRNSLYSEKGNPSPIVESLSVAGPLLVKKGSFIDVYVKSELDTLWSIDKDSSFSAVFIGQLFASLGMTTVLKKKITVEKVGWKKLQNWENQGVNGPMFSTGACFDFNNGNFVASKSGLYLASAGVKLQYASDKKSSFLITIVVNGDPWKFRTQNGMQDYLENNMNHPLSGDFYTLAAAGVVNVQQGDTISLYVRSTADENYIVSQDSRFSVIYLSDSGSIYASGGQLMLHGSISQRVPAGNSWRKVRSWVYKRANTAPGLFLMGKLQELFSNEGVIEIKEAGIYFIAAQVTINNGDNTFELAVFVAPSPGGKPALVKKYGKTDRKVYTMNLFGMLYLSSEQRVFVKVRSTERNWRWENDRSHSGLSLVRIPPSEMPASVSGGGDVGAMFVNTSYSTWMRIPRFNFDGVTQTLSGREFLYKEGYFEVMFDGIYLITWSIHLIHGSRSALHNIRLKIGVNGDTKQLRTSNSGSGSPIIFNCSYVCTNSQSEIMRLNVSDHVAMYIQYISLNPVHISKISPYLTISYLVGSSPLPYGFHTTLATDLAITGNGVTRVTGWSAVTEGQRFYRPTGANTYQREYFIKEGGIYLALVKIVVSNMKGRLTLMLKLGMNNNLPTTHCTMYYSKSDKEVTVSVTGLIKMDSFNKFIVAVHTIEDTSYKICDKSTISLVFIGKQKEITGFSAAMEETISRTLTPSWSELDGWATRLSGKHWFFQNRLHFQKSHIVIQDSGFFFISVNLICKNKRYYPVTIELSIRYNDMKDTSGFSDIKILSGGVDAYTTLQINGGMYLSRWDLLRPYLKVNTNNHDVVFDEKSTFSIVKIGQTFSSFPPSNEGGGPKIISKIMPDNIRVVQGKEISWDCFAIGGNEITYQWLKNFEPIVSATSSSYYAKDLKVSDTGQYVCRVTVQGLRAYSNIAHLAVFDPVPMFLNSPNEYVINVLEKGVEKKDLLLVRAIAANYKTANAVMAFRIVAGDPENQFQIAPNKSISNTTLSRVKQLDRETVAIYILTIEAKIPENPSLPRFQNITINVIDLNDNHPVFANNYTIITIPENTPIGTNITRVVATDSDVGLNARISYSIVPGSASAVFIINSISGVVRVSNKLDRELRQHYVISVEGSDGVFSAYAEISVTLSDVNEHRPYFITDQYIVSVAETHAPGNPIVKVSAADKDAGKNAEIAYNISIGNIGKMFYMNEKGELFNSRILDYERKHSYHLQISIHDKGNPPLYGDSVGKIYVNITDMNDFSPLFSYSKYIGYIEENTNYFNPPLLINATDEDTGINGKVSYRIPYIENISSLFTINATTGVIVAKYYLDFEVKETYQFIVQAFDSGTPQQLSTANVLIKVLDTNDNYPVFTSKRILRRIAESPTPVRQIYSVEATDADSGINKLLNYTILSGNDKGIFAVDRFTGMVVTTTSLDREVGSYYQLNISACDNGSPPLCTKDTFLLDIEITDINDNSPIFNANQYTFEAREDTAVGTVIAKITVDDFDTGINGLFNISIQGTEVFSISHDHGKVYSIRLQRSLDYEKGSMYRFNVIAKDLGTPTRDNSAPVAVNVLNMNDNAPEFQRSSHQINLDVDNIFVNMSVHKFFATDRDNPTCRNCLTYHIESGNNGAFMMNKDSGIIRIASMDSLEQRQVHQLIVRVEDSYKSPLSSRSELEIRLIVTPNIKLQQTKIGNYDFSTEVTLDGYMNTEALKRADVVVQQYHPDNPTFNTVSKEQPVRWHNIFPSGKKGEHYMRRYVARNISFKTPVSEFKINVTIGNDASCTDLKHVNKIICNGPLAAGESYRLQLRLYEKGNIVPIDSHFSIPLHIPKVDLQTAILKEVTNNGILILAAAFCAVYLITVISIFVYIGWKKKHEILYIDHLRVRHMIPLDENKQKCMPLSQSTTYFSPDTRKIQRYEAGIKNANLQGPFAEHPAYTPYEPDMYNPAFEDEVGATSWISDHNEELSLYASEDILSQGTSQTDSKKRLTVMDYFGEKGEYTSNEENSSASMEAQVVAV